LVFRIGAPQQRYADESVASLLPWTPCDTAGDLSFAVALVEVDPPTIGVGARAGVVVLRGDEDVAVTVAVDVGSRGHAPAEVREVLLTGAQPGRGRHDPVGRAEVHIRPAAAGAGPEACGVGPCADDDVRI